MYVLFEMNSKGRSFDLTTYRLKVTDMVHTSSLPNFFQTYSDFGCYFQSSLIVKQSCLEVRPT